MRVARNEGVFDDGFSGNPQFWMIAIGVVLVVLLITFLIPEGKDDTPTVSTTTPRPGGYPVPPMPVGGAVRGASAPLPAGTRCASRVSASSTKPVA